MKEKIQKYRFAFEELVSRDFKTKYKRSVLGMGWSMLQPLLLLIIMRLVFTQFFGRTMEHYTTYLFCGNLIFSYFNESTTQGMQALMANAHIFTKVNVPKYLFLLSKNVQTLINFGLTLIIFFIMCVFDGITFTWKFVFLIIPIVFLLLFNLGMGLILSALYVFFRDMQYLWRIMLQLLMYMSAIFYNVDSFANPKIFYLNPVYTFILYFRRIVIHAEIPGLIHTGLMIFYSLAALGIGCLMYKKFNHKFLYYV